MSNKPCSIRSEVKLAYLTQTTLSVDDANRIIQRLKHDSRGSKVRRRMISATQLKIAKRQSDMLSNQGGCCTRPGQQETAATVYDLRNSAANRDKQSYLIDGPQDIDEILVPGNRSSAGDGWVQVRLNRLSAKPSSG